VNSKEIDKVMESHGFYAGGTGGPCEAYIRTEIYDGVEHQFMLTDIGGCDLPNNLNRMVFGHYIGTSGQPSYQTPFDQHTTFKKVIKYINRFNQKQKFWNDVNKFLKKYSPYLDKQSVYKWDLDYIEIKADNLIYRSLPLEHSIEWVCWKPYHVLSHFSVISAKNYSIKFVKNKGK